ncbi:MAG TPA: sigma 54-interacting transcriptional regulator [Kofleriaceae bacterium]|nr:sigma 54-interacting transcriptional regulator [Kofleriaceae bacterium]
MSGGASDTVTLPRGRAGDAPGAQPQLIVALTCDRPLEPSTRHLLDAVDVVTFGRGKRREHVRRTSGGRRRLELRIADSAMSESHAQLSRVQGRWLLEDQGSKNGSVVNGKSVTRAELEDGDVVELGATFILFRDAVAPVAGGDDLAADKVPPPLPGIVTFSGPLTEQLAGAATAASSTVPVLLRGETGTGKEVVARAIHARSGRKGAFVAVNCGALPATLVEAELFGHRRGAFSGAVEDRAGHVRAADGGTLLLDEIGDLPPPAQATLLRVLQEREVVPIGESMPVRIDVRVVAATHVDLAARVADGSFRRDLLARLTGLVIELPTVADRREDVAILIAALLTASGARNAALTPAAARALFQHDWPDNVRELGMALAAAAALAGGGTIDLPHLPRAVRASAPARTEPADEAPLDEADATLREQLITLLTEHGGNISAVARATGKARWQVHRWLRRVALDPTDYRR